MILIAEGGRLYSPGDRGRGLAHLEMLTCGVTGLIGSAYGCVAY